MTAAGNLRFAATWREMPGNRVGCAAMSSHDVIVIGAGVIGLMTARELSAAGLRVCVIDRGAAGAGSTRAGGGILSPIPPWGATPEVEALALRSEARYPALARELAESTGIDIEYRQCGVLLLDEALDPAAAAWSERSGQPLFALEGDSVRVHEPALDHRWQSALRLPGLAQLRNPRLTAALVQDLERRGVELIEHTPVTGLAIAGDTLRGVHAAGRFHAATHVVVAAGAWSAGLLGPLDVTGIVPVRGQMLWYALEPGVFRHMVIHGDRYLIPRADGVCLVGSTVEKAGFDATTTVPAGTGLAEFAATLSPTLADATPAGQWAGLRPGRDGAPIIAEHPAVEGLFINAGHFRNGINLAPASAELLADRLLKRKSALDSVSYDAENRL